MRVSAPIYMVSIAAALLVAAAPVLPSGHASASTPTTPDDCTIDPPEYYAIDLVPTRNLPGLGRAGGKGFVTYDESPFGISVTENGRYVYELTVDAQHLPDRDDGQYVAWVTTPNLDEIVRIGSLDESLEATANVTYNKFLVVVTFERLDAEASQAGSTAEATPVSSPNAWRGPIILRGMSRSGLMHTMAGHGPYDSEPCAKYGY